MRKVGFILLGIGCGMLLYFFSTFFFPTHRIQSPVEEPPQNTVIQQGTNLKK